MIETQSEKFFDVLNPADGTVVGRVPLAKRKQLDLAVEAAGQAFETWKMTSWKKRREICLAIAHKIKEHAEELARLLTLEQGKISGAIAWTRYTASLSLPVKTLQNDKEGRVELHRKPIGVIGSITPWNFPVMIAIWHIIPALMTGNTLICKPSPFTPLTTLRLVELMNEILPEGVVHCITGKDEVGEAMSSHQGIGKIVFTGSTATGSEDHDQCRCNRETAHPGAWRVLGDVEPKQIAEGPLLGCIHQFGSGLCSNQTPLY